MYSLTPKCALITNLCDIQSEATNILEFLWVRVIRRLRVLWRLKFLRRLRFLIRHENILLKLSRTFSEDVCFVISRTRASARKNSNNSGLWNEFDPILHPHECSFIGPGAGIFSLGTYWTYPFFMRTIYTFNSKFNFRFIKMAIFTKQF